jgi:DNA polymerase-3 subunit epsilon
VPLPTDWGAMREIVLDTETTGLDAAGGDRLIEIGCVELINHIPTGAEFHRFLDPETREVHPDAQKIHGISTADLKGKPFFRTEADAFLEFIGEDTLIIHNAPFDVGFLNMELEKAKRPPILMSRVIDTVALARRKHPGAPASLDALCKRYGIDNSKRTKHGAIVDSLLLAEVYVELIGARQATLGLASSLPGSPASSEAERVTAGRRAAAKPRPRPLPPRLTDDDIARHAAFVETLGQDAVWKRFSQ